MSLVHGYDLDMKHHIMLISNNRFQQLIASTYARTVTLKFKE